MSTPEIAPQIPAGGLSEPERILNTFVAPTKTFNDIRFNTSWWAPFVLMAIFSYAFLFVLDHKIGWERVVQNAIAQNPKAMERIEKMPPDQRDSMMQMQVNISKYTGYAVPLFTLIAALIIAAVLMATFNFGFGTEIKYMRSLAIVMYGMLPTIVSALFTMLMMYLVDAESFDIKNPIATNPAYFMDPAKHPFFAGLASAFDIIMLWVIYLMAIGFSTNSKVKRGAAFFTIFGWYFLWKLGSAALAGAFS